MKKYIPWIIIGVIVIAGSIVSYLVFFSNGGSDSQDDLSELDAIRPVNMKIENVTSTSFTVEWRTESEATGFVKYGNTSNSLSLIAQDVNGTEPRTSHQTMVSGLTAGKKYYFYVMSENVAFGRDGRALEVLTTSEL